MGRLNAVAWAKCVQKKSYSYRTNKQVDIRGTAEFLQIYIAGVEEYEHSTVL